MRTIWYLVKFCAEEEWADDFRKGSLYLNRLSYFKKEEEEGDDDRFDKHEAVAAWLQPSGLSIKFHDHPELAICAEDLAAPVSVSFTHHNNLHVLCLYAIHTGRFECIDGFIDYAKDEADELRDHLKVHDKCLEFGAYAVIVKAQEFIERAKTAIESSGCWGRMKLVDYYDPATFNGSFSEEDIPFNKQQKHSYQNEYRIAVDSRTVGDNEFRLEIGDISDISAKISAADLNNLLKLESNAPE
jgi:hypothetical protein